MRDFNTERKTFIVIILTLITMFAEIIVGYITKSMALFADGCHMGTHALALSLTYLTYVLIRRFSGSKTFAFGTGKFSTLSGFTSSILLGVTGIFIIKEGVERFINPLAIELNEAILVAIIGFIVNFVCIVIMRDDRNHHSHNHCHSHNDGDYNYKAAYLHILSDLMTSVFAIFALFAAKFAGLNFLDPIVGILGGIIICIWAFGLIKSTGLILLDVEAADLKKEIQDHLYPDVKFADLHVWKTSEQEYSLIGKAISNIKKDEIELRINKLGNFNNIVIEFFAD